MQSHECIIILIWSILQESAIECPKGTIEEQTTERKTNIRGPIPDYNYNIFQIVMEYCGAGSVLDIMKLRGIHHSLPKGEFKPLTEDEIATVLSDTLKGIFSA